MHTHAHTYTHMHTHAHTYTHVRALFLPSLTVRSPCQNAMKDLEPEKHMQHANALANNGGQGVGAGGQQEAEYPRDYKFPGATPTRMHGPVGVKADGTPGWQVW